MRVVDIDVTKALLNAVGSLEARLVPKAWWNDAWYFVADMKGHERVVYDEEKEACALAGLGIEMQHACAKEAVEDYRKCLATD